MLCYHQPPVQAQTQDNAPSGVAVQTPPPACTSPWVVIEGQRENASTSHHQAHSRTASMPVRKRHIEIWGALNNTAHQHNTSMPASFATPVVAGLFEDSVSRCQYATHSHRCLEVLPRHLWEYSHVAVPPLDPASVPLTYSSVQRLAQNRKNCTRHHGRLHALSARHRQYVHKHRYITKICALLQSSVNVAAT